MVLLVDEPKGAGAIVRPAEYTAMLGERLGLADAAAVWGMGRERAA